MIEAKKSSTSAVQVVLWKGVMLVAALFVLMTGCAASRQALFAMTASSCGRTSDECAASCRRENDSSACDVSKVLFAEEIAAKRGQGYEPFQVTGALAEVEQLCKSDSIGRACKAASDLRPMSAATNGDAEQRKTLLQRLDAARTRGGLLLEDLRQLRGASAVDDDARTADKTLSTEVDAAVVLLGKKASPNEIEPHVAAAEGAADKIQAAQSRAKDANAETEHQRGEQRMAETARKEAAAANVAALRAARKLCEVKDGKTIPDACLRDCEANPAAWTCFALGVTYEEVDPAKARQTYRRTCDAAHEQGSAAFAASHSAAFVASHAASEAACEQLQKMDQVAAAKKKAEQDIPRLMAKCGEMAGRVRVMKAQVQAAARARDRQRLSDLQPSAQKLSTEHTEAMRDLESAINTATGGSGDRQAQLIMQSRKICIP